MDSVGDVWPDFDQIRYRSALITWVHRLKAAVKSGDLVQFYPEKAPLC
jgi:hypothetical protein